MFLTEQLGPTVVELDTQREERDRPTLCCQWHGESRMMEDEVI